MTSRRYFFFDYDGTLAVPRTKNVPAGTQDAINRLRAAGHFVALATGRLQCNALDYIDSMGIRDIVADGGYSVTIDGQLRWMQPLDLEAVQSCLRRLNDAGILWAVQLTNEPVRYSPFPQFDEVAGDYYLPTVIDESIAVEGLSKVYKIYIPCNSQQTLLYEKQGLFDGVPWVRYDSDNVFVEPLDKGFGIKKMMDELGAPYSDVVVFGDGKNDISMFLPEWTSIAMGNAVPALKVRADYVTAACDEDGVRLACEHFGWI